MKIDYNASDRIFSFLLNTRYHAPQKKKSFKNFNISNAIQVDTSDGPLPHFVTSTNLASALSCLKSFTLAYLSLRVSA